MKKSYLPIVLGLFLSSVLSGCATETAPKTGLSSQSSVHALKVRTTAYTATEYNGGGYRSAVGTRLKSDGQVNSAASDWSWLPLGTVFRMKETGRVYCIEDYGSALVGRKTIDLYMTNNRKMQSWGVRHVNIEILEMGSYERSLDVLTSRQQCRHVRRMVSALRRQNTTGPLLAGQPLSAGTGRVE